MSEGMEPEMVVEIVNRYLTLTTKCIMQNHGTLDKFVGDCTMAFWNAPVAQEDPVYLACLLEAVGEVDATMAGIDTTTYEFVLAASSIIGLNKDCASASGIQILELEEFQGEKNKFIGVADGAINIEPTVEQHAGIAIASCETFQAVTGIEAKCAFLSYSTDGSGGMSAPVKRVRDAVALAQKLRPDLKIDGEFQTDAALIERVGKKKVKRPSEVAGQANVLIFPDASAK